MKYPSLLFVFLVLCTSRSFAQGGTDDSLAIYKKYMSASDQYRKGILYYRVKDYARALPYFELAAKRQYPLATYQIGYMYKHSKGVAQDYKKAMKEFEEAAALGSSDAMVAIGYMYDKGEGVDKAPLTAMKWYEKSAALHNYTALYNVGLNYHGGFDGVARDYGTAMKYFREAADSGSDDAMYEVGKMYQKGESVGRDLSLAEQWWERAAEQKDPSVLNSIGFQLMHDTGSAQKDIDLALLYLNESAELGNSGAMVEMGYNYELGKGVVADLPTAAKWYRKAADAGDASGAYDLALFYMSGRGGLAKDDEKALKYFFQAAESGDDMAEVQIGYMYANGLGVGGGNSAAERWYHKAAAQHNLFALYTLGNFYYFGWGRKVDIDSSRVFFKEAADSGYARAQAQLGYMYDQGLGGSTDHEAAQRLYKLAAAQHSSSALFNAGNNYFYGHGGEAKNYDMALKYFREAADSGNADAQYLIGYMYEQGQGVARDKATAEKWFTTAAHGHDPAVLARIGVDLLLDSTSQQSDRSMGLRYLLESADSGSNYAMQELGYLYQSGNGVDHDDATAEKWYRRVASRHVPSALYSLGLFYCNGWGRKVNYDSAAILIKEAADSGYSDAELQTGYMHEKGQGFTPDVTEAARWYRKAADLGNQYALCNLGIFYLYGKGGLELNYDSAMHYFLMASEYDNGRAQMEIGYMHDSGKGVPKDGEKAMQWYKKAAGNGNAHALYNIGWNYENGEDGVKKSYDTAMIYLRAAAARGDDDAQLSIGYMYEHGMGVDTDRIAAVAWYRKSADQNNSIALSNMGLIYRYHHDGELQNDSLAKEYFTKSADLGFARAQTELGYMYMLGTPVTPADTATAMIWFDRAAGQHYGDALNSYAWLCCLKKINITKAIKYIKESMDQDSADINRMDTYAAILFLQGQYKEAEKYEKNSLNGGGDKKPDYLERYGDILMMLDQKDDGLRYWRMAEALPKHSGRLTAKIAAGKYIE